MEDLELCKTWLTSFINTEINLGRAGYTPNNKIVTAKEAGEAVSRGIKEISKGLKEED